MQMSETLCAKKGGKRSEKRLKVCVEEVGMMKSSQFGCKSSLVGMFGDLTQSNSSCTDSSLIVELNGLSSVAEFTQKTQNRIEIEAVVGGGKPKSLRKLPQSHLLESVKEAFEWKLLPPRVDCNRTYQYANTEKSRVRKATREPLGNVQQAFGSNHFLIESSKRCSLLLSLLNSSPRKLCSKEFSLYVDCSNFLLFTFLSVTMAIVGAARAIA